MICRKTFVLVFLSFIFIKTSSSQTYKEFNSLSTYESGITVLTKDLDNKLLIAGDEKGNLYFHDLVTGKPIKKIKVHAAAVSQLQFNSNGRLLISSTSDGEIKIYDFKAERIIQAIYSPDYSGIHFVLFSIADGFIYFNGEKKLFKTRSDLTQQVDNIMTESDTITDAVITNDRSSLIYAVGRTLKILNTRTDFVSQEFNTPLTKIKKIALVNDTLLATWSIDGTIYFWKYSLGQINSTPIYFFKAGAPSTMNFSDDGKLMCTGNIGNWARIWKPRDKTVVQELFGHKSTVTSACFGKNNSTIYTGGLDGKIISWRNDTIIPPAKIVEEPPKIKVDTVKTERVTRVNDIEMGEGNVPKYIFGRKVVSNQKIDVDTSAISIYVFDNSYNDGDTMSLFFNGEWILNHYCVTKVKKAISLKLTPNTNNFLVLFANNLGKTPPNTAAIEFQDGKTKKFLRLSSDLKSCSAINFFYKK